MTLAFMLLSLTFAHAKTHETSTTDNPVRKAQPRVQEPTIYVCEDSGARLRHVKKALRKWNKLEYRFSQPFVVWCDENRTPPNSFMIRGPGEHIVGNYVGWSSVMGNPYTAEVVTCEIELKESDARVIAHEIGHCLGWNHNRQHKHLMQPYDDLGGWKMQGLENVRHEYQ